MEVGDEYSELRGAMIRGRCESIEDEAAMRAVISWLGAPEVPEVPELPAQQPGEVRIRVAAVHASPDLPPVRHKTVAKSRFSTLR